MHKIYSASRALIIAVSLCAFVSSCGKSKTVNAPAPLISEADLKARLAELQSRRMDVQGFAVAVYLPNGTIVSAATGEADPDGRPMTPDTPVRMASITKTFVAVAVLRLWEDKSIDLDASIGDLISAEHSEILTSDGYDVDRITVRHLLMHAGGLNDHFGGDAFKSMVLSEPTRKWTRTDQLKIMIDTTDPVSEPGYVFAYSDTGYLLLGEILERLTDEPLGSAVRRLVKFDRIGIADAWWDAEETPSENVPNRAHQWLGDIDTYPIDGSVDAYGGGGVVANAEDIARFFSALFSGEVFDRAETLQLMIEAPGHPEESPYRIGLFERSIHGHVAFGHGGFWGTDVFVLPELNVTVSGVALNASGIDDLRQWEAELIKEYIVSD